MDPTVDVAAFFREFYAQFDIALMGRKTYEFVGGPIEGISTYVFSRTLSPSACPGVTVVAENGIEVVRRLRSQEGRDIWLFGGGGLFGSLAAARLVDRLELGVMPVLLGEGVPVMSGIGERVKLKLLEMEQTGLGAVSLKYQVNYGA
jgi:dihydrofolate reductase